MVTCNELRNVFAVISHPVGHSAYFGRYVSRLLARLVAEHNLITSQLIEDTPDRGQHKPNDNNNKKTKTVK